MPSTEANVAPDERRRRVASFWQTMVYLTSLGWLMALPIAGGVLLGHYLDVWLGSGRVWTQVGLGVGIGLALVEAYLASLLALRAGRRGSRR